jgi:hypothetical protein
MKRSLARWTLTNESGGGSPGGCRLRNRGCNEWDSGLSPRPSCPRRTARNVFNCRCTRRMVGETRTLLKPTSHPIVTNDLCAVFDDVWRAIWSACVACRVAATGVDQSHRHENIWDEVCAAIAYSDFTIAVAAPEASGVPNPNVMLEIGYARALKKPVLLLTSAPDTRPFDLRTERALLYEPRAVGGERFTKTWSRLLMG